MLWELREIIGCWLFIEKLIIIFNDIMNFAMIIIKIY